jgi:hypothetical protein
MGYPGAYSDSERYARQVINDVVYLLGKIDVEALAAFCEYLSCLGSGWRYFQPAPIPTFPRSTFELATSAHYMCFDRLRASKALSDVLQRWTLRRLLSDEPVEDAAGAALRARFALVPGRTRADLVDSLLVESASLLYSIKVDSVRSRLAAQIRQSVPKIKEGLRVFAEQRLERFG